jgi:dTDP-4-amino-4,6-dideoxygalactose transaminase
MDALSPHIKFHVPFVAEGMEQVFGRVLNSDKLAGGGGFTKSCERRLSDLHDHAWVSLTHSCTAALEAAALLLDLRSGDEVIMPSFTFSSTANAFALRGAVPVFVDVRTDTLNIDEKLIEAAVTPRTRAVCVVHYAGVPAEMGVIGALARKHGFAVVEDAAQALGSTYRGHPAGALGEIGCLSFHDTKNIGCGEGGALIVRDPVRARRAAILAEKGTNRTAFFRGEVDKYTWLEAGLSLLPSEIEAAMLDHNLGALDRVTARRLALWERYRRGLSEIEASGRVSLAKIPADVTHNAHIFAIRLRSEEERARLAGLLAADAIGAVRHYVPLHSAPAASHVSRTASAMTETDRAGDGLLRLPIHSAMTDAMVDRVIDRVTFHLTSG